MANKKSQKEISQNLSKPYLDSTTKKTISKKRAEDISFKNDNSKPFEIGLEDIDTALIYFLQNVLDLNVLQDQKLIKPFMMFKNPENWITYQKEGIFRDRNGKIMLPVISIDKTNIDRNKSLTTKVDHLTPLNYYVYGQKYSKSNTYNTFDVLNNNIPEKTYYVTVIPEYVNVTYSIILMTNYIHQLNKLIETFTYSADSYWGEPEKFQFLTMIKNFSPTVELETGEERVVKCQFELIIKGYILPNTLQKVTNSIQKINNYQSLNIDFKENTSNG